MAVYYNDSDPFVCQWLRNLIADGLLPAGEVDERPIEEVTPEDVRAFTQCHFFAGIGGWPLALALAGWGDRPVWTGSCPCQPFSAAGKRKAHDDERHLWPAWLRLIQESRPERIFGEQVAGAAGLGWLDVVSTDLEAEGYAVGACVLGAHSVGAPHQRQRLYFVADTLPAGRAEGRTQPGDGSAPDGSGTSELAHPNGGESSHGGVQRSGEHGQRPQDGLAGRLDDPTGARHHGSGQGPEGETRDDPRLRLSRDGSKASGMAESLLTERRTVDVYRQDGRDGQDAGRAEAHGQPGARSEILNPWSDCLWLPCRDGKVRPIPVEPRLFPLAQPGTIRNRVALLRGSGNAICPQTAAAFVSAYMDLAEIATEAA